MVEFGVYNYICVYIFSIILMSIYWYTIKTHAFVERIEVKIHILFLDACYL